jgi:uncharacterized lipoprotein NlpE involved in copper resistance
MLDKIGQYFDWGERTTVKQKMKSQVVFMVALLGVLGLMGCENRPQVRSTYEKIPFTHSLRMEYNLTTPELKRLQFYVSHPVQLRNVATSGKYEIAKGKLVTKAGQDVNEIVVNQGTPGIAVDVRDPELRISFEENFSFGFVRGTGAQSDVYVVAYTNDKENQPIVRYGGGDFMMAQNSKLSHLLINKEELTEMVNKRRVLPGRRIIN